MLLQLPGLMTAKIFFLALVLHLRPDQIEEVIFGS
jgi:hypothetical protein